MLQKNLKPSDIKNLLTVTGDPCVTIYMPTHERGNRVKEDPIRLKNLLRQCEKKLNERGLTGERLKIFLQPAWDLVNASVTWAHLDHGLGLYLCHDVFHVFVLPITCAEEVSVDTHFYIKPLMRLWRGDESYYVLTLSRGHTKLYQADRWSMDEIKLPGAPVNLADFLKYDDAEEHLQSHSTPSGKSGGADIMYHGHGNRADDAQRKKSLNEYIKAVRSAVEKVLSGESLPLVLVAPTYIDAIYRKISRYPHLLETGFKQTSDRMSAVELREITQAVMAPHFAQRKSNSLALFRERLAQGAASDKIEEILPAAHEGRIDTLLLDPSASVWSDDPHRPSFRDGEEEPAELLEIAVRSTLAQGGNVCAVGPEEMPTQTRAGAIFRY
jgi:hypothetical protein